MSVSRLGQAALRGVAGGFILNSGLDKWRGDEDTAKGVHGMAAGTYPFLASVPSGRFLKLLAGSEIALGAALLAPFVPAAAAGAALVGFSAGLVGLYLRTPGMHDGRLRPTPQGLPIAKDVWLLGIGASLVADDVAARRSRA